MAIKKVTAWSLVPAERQVLADLCTCSDNSVLLMKAASFEKSIPLDLLLSQFLLQHSDCVILAQIHLI